MSSNEPEPHLEDETTTEETEPNVQPHYLLPASIQLINTFAIEIAATRYPVPITGNLDSQAHVQIEGVQIDEDNLHAQVILSIKAGFSNEPRPFEISFKLVGIFTYSNENPGDVIQFLNQGSLSVLMPFARELLISLCTRLQVPPLILQMIQLVPPPASKEDETEKSE
jgi:preprotein translocase subunit SecB